MPNTSEKTRESGEIKKIVVDRDTCIGCGSCTVIAEAAFELDEKNLCKVKDDIEGIEDATLKMAAESCPVQTIHLYDESGNKIFPKE